MSVPRPSDASVDKMWLIFGTSNRFFAMHPFQRLLPEFANMGMPILQSRDMANWIIFNVIAHTAPPPLNEKPPLYRGGRVHFIRWVYPKYAFSALL